MPQLSRRELRNSLVLIMGLAATSLVTSTWFCESQHPEKMAESSGTQIAPQIAPQIASAGIEGAWGPVMAGIELSSASRDAHKIEWVHPEGEVKTERSKILKGLEASF
jgi:hypothetical protein